MRPRELTRFPMPFSTPTSIKRTRLFCTNGFPLFGVFPLLGWLFCTGFGAGVARVRGRRPIEFGSKRAGVKGLIRFGPKRINSLQTLASSSFSCLVFWLFLKLLALAACQQHTDVSFQPLLNQDAVPFVRRIVYLLNGQRFFFPYIGLVKFRICGIKNNPIGNSKFSSFDELWKQS